MKEYYTTHLVKGEDLNHHGTLFAARTAAWFVESAFIAAACEHGNSEEILCRNLHGMSFSMPVKNGDVVQFVSRVVYAGATSMMVHVSVRSSFNGDTAVEGFLTFVTVSRQTGKKVRHSVVLDETEDPVELKEREEAVKLRNSVKR